MGTLGRRQGKNQETFKFTEKFIQDSLDRYFSPSYTKYAIENLYVFDWESDKIIIPKSNYVYEFEIKISKADFKNDFKHKKDKHVILEGDYKNHKIIPKGEEIIKEAEERSRNNPYYGYNVVETTKKNIYNNEYFLVENHKRPNYFFYAVPEGLLEESEIPSYAGLIFVDEYGRLKVVKAAPRLHDKKYTEEEMNLTAKFYYNMKNWQYKAKKAMEENKMLYEKMNNGTIFEE